LLLLQKRLSQVNKVVIVGAGLLGLELASALEGKKITIIELSERILPKQLDEVASFLLKDYVEKKGIEIILGTKIKNIETYHNGLEIVLSNGQPIYCDILIFSAGVVPNTEFIKSPENILNSIKRIEVNYKMQTKISNVYACGDVAHIDGQESRNLDVCFRKCKNSCKKYFGI